MHIILLKEKYEGLWDVGQIMLVTRGKSIVGELDEIEG